MKPLNYFVFFRKIKFYSLIILIIFIISCTSKTKEEEKEEKEEKEIINQFRQEKNFKEKDVFKLGENIILKGENLTISNFKQLQPLKRISASKIYGCNDRKYFIENTNYCVFFENFWAQLLNPKEEFISIWALGAYTNTDMDEFLFKEAKIAINSSSYLLNSSTLYWDSDSTRLYNNKKDDTNEFLGQDNSSVKGSFLNLNYEKGQFTLKDALVSLPEGEIE